MLRTAIRNQQSLTTRIPLATTIRGFHVSNVNFDDKPPSSNSPLKVFFDTFKQEVKKSSELKENIKALQDESGRMAESEAFKRAKEAYARAQKGRSAAGKAVKKTADVVGGAAYKAWESPVERCENHRQS